MGSYLSEELKMRLTVLVVEDEWLVRLSLLEFLEDHDCDVIQARNGEAAVEALHRLDGIDIVVTDIRLGGELTGWDVAEIFRASDPAIPVVYTSGEIGRPERHLPGSRFLSKPYQPEKVLAACRKLHEERQAG